MRDRQPLPRPFSVRRLLVRLALGAVTLGLLAPAAPAADDELVTEVKSANLRWTLPNDEWSFRDIAAADKAAGYVARANSRDGKVLAVAYVSASEGLPLADRLQELRAAMGPARLDDEIVEQKVIDTTLSGIRGGCVVISGRASSGATGHLRLYGIEHKGRFYHLLIEAYNGGHTEHKDEINALRRGFRLIKGAGGEDADDGMDEVADATGEGAGAAGGKGGGDDEPWPAKGPVRDGNKLAFTGYNLEWTLPDGGPWTWRNPIDDLANAFRKTERGVSLTPMVEAQAVLKRKKKEFEQDSPDNNQAIVNVSAAQMTGQRNSEAFMRSPAFQEELSKNNGVAEWQSSETRIRDNTPMGNFKGTMGVFVGENRQGHEVTIVYFETMLRGWLYNFTFTLMGWTDRLKQFQGPIQKLMGGVNFPNNQDNVPGPMLGTKGIGPFSGERGTLADKKLTLAFPGVAWSAGKPGRSGASYSEVKGWKLKKPEGMAILHVAQTESRMKPIIEQYQAADGDQAKQQELIKQLPYPHMNGMERTIQFAGEQRAMDGQAYLYLEVAAEGMGRLQNEKKSMESVVDEMASAWSASAGEGAMLSKSGKKPYYKQTSFRGKAKGFKYAFSATKDDVPFFENGYVVKYGQCVFTIRIQTAGTGCEKLLKKMVKTLEKGWSWER